MSQPVSKAEQDLVIDAANLVSDTAYLYSSLMPTRTSTHPIPFFGSLKSARVITLGLNPSQTEFARNRCWSREIKPDVLAERLVNYFINSCPGSHRWFRPWSIALESLGVSYDSGAAHIDLSPRATRGASQFRDENEKALFLAMVRTDAPIWIAALRAAPKVAYILAAGSATNEHYINEFIRDELTGIEVGLSGQWRRGHGPGQIAFHTLSLPSGAEIPFFFCSTGPTKQGGTILVQAVRSQAIKLRQEVEIMERRVIVPPLTSTFKDVYDAIGSELNKRTPRLITTGGVPFVAEAGLARDGRRFISLPHNNRIYEADWGFMSNGMGKEGQRIGHYSRPLDNWARGFKK